MNKIEVLTLLNLGFLGLNVVVLGLTIKVYTELIKDKLQDKRKESK